MNEFANILTILGYVIEISGIVIMANRFLDVDVISLIIGLITAPFKSGISGMISEISRGAPEDVSKTFRGLSLIAWGFSLQFIAFIIGLMIQNPAN